MTQEMAPKMTLQNDPSKRSPLIHAHKAQGHAEIGNHWNRNGFGDLTFPIGFALRITWTFA